MGDHADDCQDAAFRNYEMWDEFDFEEHGGPIPLPYRRRSRFRNNASKETRDARHAAHLQLDCLWEFGGMTRSDAYVLVQKLMGMSPAGAHIRYFSIAQCEELVRKLQCPTYYLLMK